MCLITHDRLLRLRNLRSPILRFSLDSYLLENAVHVRCPSGCQPNLNLYCSQIAEAYDLRDTFLGSACRGRFSNTLGMPRLISMSLLAGSRSLDRNSEALYVWPNRSSRTQLSIIVTRSSAILGSDPVLGLGSDDDSRMNSHRVHSIQSWRSEGPTREVKYIQPAN